MNDIYEIRTVKDFLKVPSDKRVAMISDFTEWLSICDAISATFIPEEIGVCDWFTWKDDGISGLSEINIHQVTQA